MPRGGFRGGVRGVRGVRPPKIRKEYAIQRYYMTKTLNQIWFFFPSPKSEYLFSNIGNQKLNGPSLMNDTSDVERKKF
jgi:hypothetical protein